MKKHMFLKTLSLLVLLMLIFLGFSFAQQSKVTPIIIDQQIISFIQNQQPVVSKSIKEAKKQEIRSMIAAIKGMCGDFNVNTDILTSAKCSTIDPTTHNRVTFEMNCQNGSCNFSKR